MLVTAPLAALLEILFPIVFAIWFMRWTRAQGKPLRWQVIVVGAAAFLLAQVLHIPFLSAVSPLVTRSLPENVRVLGQAVYLGLAAGVFEETARAICYALLKDKARSWNGGVALGIGHGGAEAAIFIGLSGLVNFIYLLYVRGNPQVIAGNAQAQIAVASYWASAWYVPLVGVVERVSAFVLQIGLSLLVLQAFTRRNPAWFVLAVLWHALIDAVAVFGGLSGWGVILLEGVVAVGALVSVWFSLALRPHEATGSDPETGAGPIG
jgi:uncharacterized membrane protein YhfC